MTFQDLNLDSKILKALTQAGYQNPTEIQSKAIPHIMEGQDLRGSAQTGTGKTAAFLLPALHHIVTHPSKEGRGPRVLILVPTRELAMQIATQTEKYSRYLDRVKAVCISGGVPYAIQMRKLNKPYEILIATPGRLIDYLNQKKISFDRLDLLVLDEADRMLDMGFTEPVDQIVAETPASRQTLLFSATLQGNIAELSKRLLNNPVDVVVHHEHQKHDNIQQQLYLVDNLSHKNRLLDHILAQNEVQCSIIFTSTKRHACQLVEELKEKGHHSAALHGDMKQSQRTRTINQMKSGKYSVLVATDVAARGLDVPQISHVINFDLPRCIEDYVHRIGRTGRAGANGIAMSFAADRDINLLSRIEKLTGQKIDRVEIEGLEPSKKNSNKPNSNPNQKQARDRRRPKKSFKSKKKDLKKDFVFKPKKKQGAFKKNKKRSGFSKTAA